MVASSHQLCVKPRNNRSRHWEQIIYHLFSSHHSQATARVRSWKVVSLRFIIWINQDDHIEMSFYAVQPLAPLSPYVRVSKGAVITFYVRTVAVAVSAKYLGCSLFPALVHYAGQKVKFQLRVLEVGSFQEHDTRFIQLLHYARSRQVLV